MTVSDVLIIWQQQQEQGLEPDPVVFRIRTANAEMIQEVQKKYGKNKSQIINDLLAIGIAQLNHIES